MPHSSKVYVIGDTGNRSLEIPFTHIVAVNSHVDLSVPNSARLHRYASWIRSRVSVPVRRHQPERTETKMNNKIDELDRATNQLKNETQRLRSELAKERSKSSSLKRKLQALEELRPTSSTPVKHPKVPDSQLHPNTLPQCQCTTSSSFLVSQGQPTNVVPVVALSTSAFSSPNNFSPSVLSLQHQIPYVSNSQTLGAPTILPHYHQTSNAMILCYDQSHVNPQLAQFRSPFTSFPIYIT
jgi:hypothetical protein